MDENVTGTFAGCKRSILQPARAVIAPWLQPYGSVQQITDADDDLTRDPRICSGTLL
jgi:hypothetical protein